MIKRNTIQSSLVYETVNKLQNHPTADEVYDAVAENYPTISRGTVYRNLNQLSDMGKINKIEIPGGPNHFDHISHKHYHVRCVMCSRIFDVDMDYFADLESKIKDAHGFKFISHDIIFNGICPECSK